MRRAIRLLGALLLAALFGMPLGLAQAQAAETFTLQPGGRATITFVGFCTNYGQAFPSGIEAPSALADADVRAALAYIQQQGLGENQADALEAQYGIWRIQNAPGSPQGGQIATDVVNAAGTPVQEPQGTSLLDAVQAGQVTVSIDSWQPLGEQVQVGTLTDYFYGQGTLTVENTSGQELTLYHPVGALYAPTEAGAQTMGVYATNIEVQNPQPTPQPTSAADQATANQPSQLPQTSASDSAPWLPALSLAALLLLAAGWATVRGLSRGRAE